MVQRARLKKRPKRRRQRQRARLLEDEFPVISKTKCTAELTKRFCKLIRKGVPPDAACDYLGISQQTFWVWTRRGQLYEAGLEGGGNTTPADAVDRAYGHFYKRFKRAFAKYRIARVTSLHAKGNANWYREMAILERRDRATWGRKEQQGGSDEVYDPDDKFL